MKKRLKSFFISLGSFALASLTALVFTPQWADFINWVGSTGQDTLLGWGVPAVVVIVFGKFIDEVWRQLINNYIAKKGDHRSVASASYNGEDTY